MKGEGALKRFIILDLGASFRVSAFQDSDKCYSCNTFFHGSWLNRYWQNGQEKVSRKRRHRGLKSNGIYSET